MSECVSILHEEQVYPSTNGCAVRWKYALFIVDAYRLTGANESAHSAGHTQPCGVAPATQLQQHVATLFEDRKR